MTKWNDWNTAEITDKASSPVKLAGKQLTMWNESNGRAASEKSRHLFHPLPNPDILYSKPNVGSVPIKDSLLNSVLPYLFVEKQKELFQILMKKKLIHLWPKPAASFTFKTCYSSTMQVILPRGLNSTASSTTPTFIMSISHHQQRCQCAPEATNTAGQTQNWECLLLWQSHGSLWCGAGGEQQELLFIIPYQCSRGTQGGGCCDPWQPPGLSCPIHTAFSPWISGAGTWCRVAVWLPGHRQNKHSSSLPGKALLCSSPSSFISSL